MFSKESQGRTWAAVAVVLTIVLAGVVGLNIVKYTSADAADAADRTESTAAVPELEPDPVPTTRDVVADDSPHVLDIVVSSEDITVSGTAPSSETGEAMRSVVTDLYGVDAAASFTVGESIFPDWYDSYPTVIRQIGFLSEARLEVRSNQTILTGKAPRQRDVDALLKTLSGVRGFPPLELRVTITNQDTAQVVVARSDSQISVAGEVSSPKAKRILIETIQQGYEDVQVVDALSINTSIGFELNLNAFAQYVVALNSFNKHSTSYNRGHTYAFVSGELSFAPGENELTAESTEIVASLPEFLIKSDLSVRIIGRTDDVGDDRVNTILSIARAKAVADQLLEAGVNAERVIVVGRGERGASGPDASEEERANERGVDIEIGTVI